MMVTMKTIMTRRRFSTLLSGVMVFPVLAGGVVAPQESRADSHTDPRFDAARRVIDSLLGDLNALVDSGLDENGTVNAVDAMIDAYFDFDRMARFAAGDAWEWTSDGQKKRFLKFFRYEVLGALYEFAENLVRIDYTHLDAEAQGRTQIIMNGRIRDPSGRISAEKMRWRFYAGDDNMPRIMDLEIENISMLIDLKGDYADFLAANDGDFEKLLRELNNIHGKYAK